MANKKPSTNVTFIDLFAGIGGFRIALESLGAKCLFSSEWDKYATITYNANFNEKPDGDITKIKESDIPKHDILSGGFPCQAFSISGKQNGFNDTRGTLFFDIARIAKNCQPKVLFLENVRNLAKHNNGKTLETILRVLDDIGYKTFFKILNASFFGVPQSRERVYFVCFRKDLKISTFDFPKPSNESICIKDIIEPDANTDNYLIDRKDITFSSKYKNLKEDLFEHSALKPIRIGKINKGGQGERIYDEYGHAITFSAYGGGVAGKTGAYYINGKVRQLSPRECLRCLGFPEWFKFPLEITKTQAYKQCGNSVAVPVLRKIAAKILAKLGL